jgi:hypothetical protein
MSVGTVEETDTMVYLHFSDNTPSEESEIQLSDGRKVPVIWKDILVAGEYPMSPGPNGAEDRTLKVVVDGESNLAENQISMADLIDAHEDKAFKYVTVPTKHRDDLLDNTGYVPRPAGLRKIERDGNTVLQAALGFTEPDIKGKVQRGTIPDVSAGIFRNFLNKHTKKRYRAALKHVALTPTPFMGNLNPFPAIFASDDELNPDTKIEVYEFADGDPSSIGTPVVDSSKTAEIVWNEKDGASYLSQQLNEALQPARSEQVDDGRPFTPQPSYYVQDISPTKSHALVEEFFKGNSTRFVVPFTIDDDSVTPAPATRWVEVRSAMIAASDDFISAEVIAEKLTTYLSENFGADNFRVADVSLNHRARIENTVEAAAWIAPFTLFSDGEVALAPSHRWEATTAPEPKEEAEQPVASPLVTVQMMSGVGATSADDFSDRLKAARQRRRNLVANPH